MSDVKGFSIRRTQPQETLRPRRINYDLMNQKRPELKRQLEQALASNDPVEVAKACHAAYAVWTECGAWPDDWSEYQRALDDVLGPRQWVNLDDLLNGVVVIERVERDS